MFGSVYTGMSGLLTFSRGLDVISNNVANLNTPGHKGSDLLFQDIFYRYGLSGESGQFGLGSQIGNGVTGERTSLRTSQGEIRETGNQTDAAIDGNGFFILRKEGETTYTRAGQFEVDEQGYLVAQNSQARVAGYQSGQLVDINISALRNSAPSATTEIRLINNLSTGSAEHEISDVEVFDAIGGRHTLNLLFRNDNGIWSVEVTDENDEVVATGGEIRFQGNGSPQEGANTFTFDFSPENVDTSRITLNFGEPGSFSSATSFSSGASSDLAVESQNGFGNGALIELGFNRNGALTAEFSNGRSLEGTRIALAWFQDLQSLRQIGGGLFVADDNQEALIDAPGQGVMGELVGGSIELSNVDLTLEFTDLIIMQRGFQGSSQILTVANEMMQQLLDIGRGGR
ncbi:MAG TPA: flagellar hook-basal body complex protein [Gammaproteobacteria bacterium]|nr:flagellar hook-basal body complex protein [Gammaproteobacteria bacterium]